MFNIAAIKGTIKSVPIFLKNTTLVVGAAAKKHAPVILLGAGCAAVITGTVIACVKSTEMPDIIEETKKKSEEINGKVGKAYKDTEVTEQVETDYGGVVEVTKVVHEQYTVEDAKHDLTKLYFSTCKKVLKLYWLPTLLISGGMVMIGSSHHIMSARLTDANKKLLATTAACEGIAQVLDKYRGKVKEEQGDEVDNKYFTEAVKEVKEVKEAAIKNNEAHHMRTPIDILSGDGDPTCRIFDEVTSKYWRKEPIYNLAVIKGARETCLKTMKSRYKDLGYGFLYLWEAELLCGLVPSKDSYTLGWLYNPRLGDEQLSFGLDNSILRMDGVPISESSTMEFLMGKSSNVMLMFNCTEDVHEVLSDHNILDNFMEGMNY